jgi:hypothetical protein
MHLITECGRAPDRRIHPPARRRDAADGEGDRGSRYRLVRAAGIRVSHVASSACLMWSTRAVRLTGEFWAQVHR